MMIIVIMITMITISKMTLYAVTRFNMDSKLLKP